MVREHIVHAALAERLKPLSKTSFWPFSGILAGNLTPAKSLYYHLKPFLPRSLRLAVRRWAVDRARPRYNDVWPIKESAGRKPPRWASWPEGKQFALVLTHDVEGPNGLARVGLLSRLEARRGFRSSFNFIPEGNYVVPKALQDELRLNGFEVGVHDLHHNGKLYNSWPAFHANAQRINRFLRQWDAVGFRSGFMHHHLPWLHELNIEYDSSTFDTDPFEPQPDDVDTVFPFWVRGPEGGGYVELPYTLAQDYTLFVLMREPGIECWKHKLDWIAARGGMALVLTHPDYMSFGERTADRENYGADLYDEFLAYVNERYKGAYWHRLPREVASYWRSSIVPHEDDLMNNSRSGPQSDGFNVGLKTKTPAQSSRLEEGLAPLCPGQWVEIRSAAEIAGTLGADGCLDGLPFMQEMLPFCGTRRKVAARIDKLCVEGAGIRRFQRGDVVLLQDAYCDGSAHGGCQKYCTVLWKERWLKKLADGSSGETPEPHPRIEEVPFPYPMMRGERIYACQSTELAKATLALTRLERMTALLKDASSRRCSILKAGSLVLSGLLFRCMSRFQPNRTSNFGTASRQLGLQPGELVRVKPLQEIMRTLDSRGKHHGLTFTRYMLSDCGREYRVKRRVERIILEETGEMRPIKDTVLLEGVTCNGQTCSGFCPRGLYHFWREIWLDRAPGVKNSDRVTVPKEPVRQVRRFEEIDFPRWDRFVESHPSGSVFHLSGWRTALEKAFPHIKGCFLGIEENSRLVAGIPICFVKSHLLGNRIVSVPFAFSCDPLLSLPQDIHPLIEAVMDAGKLCSCRRVELKTLRPIEGPFEEWQFGVSRFHKHHYLPLAKTEDELMKSFSRTCVRQQISKAQKLGINVREADLYADLDAFYRLYFGTRRGLGLPAFPKRFFKALVESFGPSNLSLLFATSGPCLVGGALALKYKDVFTLEYVGYSPEARDMGANPMLYWEAIKLARRSNYRVFSFGRTSPRNTGLIEFKRRWGTIEEDVQTYVFPSSACENVDSLEMSLRYQAFKTMTRYSPVSVYGTLSSFACRHLG